MDYCQEQHKVYKVHFSKLRPLNMQSLIDLYEKIANLTADDLQRVKLYIGRTTNHGQTKVGNLIGTQCKKVIRFVLSDAIHVNHLEGLIEAYNRNVATFNDQLSTSACRRAVDIEELNTLKNELLAQHKYLYDTVKTSGCIQREMLTDEDFVLCMDCKSMITTGVTARDMTVEELEQEKKEVAIEQDRLDRYDCTSSFCFVSCRRCEHRFRKITPGTKKIRNTETCLCGTQYVSSERSNRY